MPVVPSVRMASPEPIRSHNNLISMEVDQILTLVGTDPITNGHLLFVMGALILQRAQKCEVRQVTKDVVKSEV